jgi:hypothetical protein
MTSLAIYAPIEPGMRDVVAFQARVSGTAHPSRRNWQSLANRFGCTVLTSQPFFAGRVHDYFAFLLMRGLTWVFNPQRHLVRGTNAVRFDMDFPTETTSPLCPAVLKSVFKRPGEHSSCVRTTILVF